MSSYTIGGRCFIPKTNTILSHFPTYLYVVMRRFLSALNIGNYNGSFSI